MNFRRTTYFILKHLKPYSGWMFVLFIAATTSHIFRAYWTVFYKEFVDALFLDDTTAQLVIFILLQILVIDLITYITKRIVGFIDVYIPPKVIANIESEAFNNLQHHSFQFFSNSFSGSLVKKISRLSDAYLGISDNILYTIYPAIILIVTTLYLTLRIDVSITITLGIWVIVFLSLNTLFAYKRIAYEQVANAKDSIVGGYYADVFSNILNVITFGKYTKEAQQQRKVINDWKIAKSLYLMKQRVLWILSRNSIFRTL